MNPHNHNIIFTNLSLNEKINFLTKYYTPDTLDTLQVSDIYKILSLLLRTDEDGCISFSKEEKTLQMDIVNNILLDEKILYLKNTDNEIIYYDMFMQSLTPKVSHINNKLFKINYFNEFYKDKWIDDIYHLKFKFHIPFLYYYAMESYDEIDFNIKGLKDIYKKLINLLNTHYILPESNLLIDKILTFTHNLVINERCYISLRNCKNAENIYIGFLEKLKSKYKNSLIKYDLDGIYLVDTYNTKYTEIRNLILTRGYHLDETHPLLLEGKFINNNTYILIDKKTDKVIYNKL